MSRFVKSTSVFVALWLCAGSVQAQMQNEMTRMFNEQGNVTGPGVVVGSRRGVVMMGNLSIRSPIVRTDELGLNMQMPSITAGCGGIDIQGGSLSFPSSERFVDIARAIAANAKGYAFKLALGAMCDKCEGLMTEIQNLVNQLGAGNKSSCEIATSIMDSTGASAAIQGAAGSVAPAMNGWAERASAALRTAQGDAPDRHAASEQGSTGSAVTAAYQEHPEEMRRLAVGNLVWDALKRGDFGSWMGAANGQRLREEMMSITGTVVACVAGEDDCQGPEGQDRDAGLVINTMPATLSLKDLTMRASYGGVTLKRKIWTCPDADLCLAPEEKTVTMAPSIADEILSVYLGENGEPGLLAYARAAPGQHQITAREAAVSRAAGMVGQAAMRMALRDPQQARAHLLRFAELAAARYVHTYLSDVFRELLAVMRADRRETAAASFTQVSQSWDRLNTDFARIEQSKANELVIYSATMDNLRAAGPMATFPAPAQ